MENNKRNIILPLFVILAVACVCAALVFGGGLLVNRLAPRQVSPTATPIILPTPLPTLTEESGLDPDISAAMDLIQAQVINLRGLEPSSAVPRQLLSPDQLRENVINDFLSDYTPTDAEQDAEVLAMLGLLPEGFDLISLYTDLYSEQIAGYYDNEAGAMYVVQGAGFGGMERSTYAHEYVHVLQDQTYHFTDGLGYTDELCQADTERCAGIQALIEGDATVTELQWFTRFATQDDYQDLMDFYNTFTSPVFDNAPHYMKTDFTFPYDKGQIFVQYLLDQGGFAAVDAAYLNVPLSTEQILHPEKYPSDFPIPVDIPDLSSALGEGWEEVERNVMGEWYIYLILGHGHEEAFRIQEREALKAAEGWGGDTYLVYNHPASGKYAFVMRMMWDEDRDAEEFTRSFRMVADARWGRGQQEADGTFTWLSHNFIIRFDPVTSTWLMAPDVSLMEALWRNLP